jgi:hypothetical protein
MRGPPDGAGSGAPLAGRAETRRLLALGRLLAVGASEGTESRERPAAALAAAALAAREVFVSAGFCELEAAFDLAAGVSMRVSASASGSVGLGLSARGGALSNAGFSSAPPLVVAAAGGAEARGASAGLVSGGFGSGFVASGGVAAGAWLLPASNAASHASSSPSSVGGGVEAGFESVAGGLVEGTGAGANDAGEGTEGAGMPINVDLLADAGGRDVGRSERARGSAAGGAELAARGGPALVGGGAALPGGGVMLGAGMPISVRLLADAPEPGGALAARGAVVPSVEVF